jgi:hypothetical protein
MPFFDSKQEVLDIQLTSYGKKLLSKGNFDPSFYCFFDDNIIYDSDYYGISTEANGDADERIRTQTPRLKSDYSLVGSEIKFSESDTNSLITNVISYETETILKYNLGNASLTEQTASYYNINFSGNEITSVEMTASLNALKPNESFSLKRPKISLEKLKFTPEIRELPNPTLTSPPETFNPETFEIPSVSPVLSDSRYIYNKTDSIFFFIDEKNVENDFKNFEINVYKRILTEDDVKYKKLFIEPNPTYIDSEGFLLDGISNESFDGFKIQPRAQERLDSYFNLYTDEEIPINLITSKVARDSFNRPIINDVLIEDATLERINPNLERSITDNEEPC